MSDVAVSSFATANAGPARSFYDILDELRALATSEADKGTRFERLTQAYLRVDPIWADQFDEVWLWPEWEGNAGKHDSGIDLVARDRVTGELTAIQCKFFGESTTVTKEHIDTFLSASGKAEFSGRLVIATSDKWSHHAEDAIKGQQIPVRRVGLADFEASPIDWRQFSLEKPSDLVLSEKKDLRKHQREAIAGTLAGFKSSDRGKVVMACGTGKTFTSLRLAEQLVGAGGAVLFLVPSISLLSQSLREWVSDAEVPLSPLAVCSDRKVSQKRESPEDISTVDLALPATTNVDTVHARLSDAMANSDRMTVVFATYQSIDVVARAQSADEVRAFDLVICDEAHRTTGVTLAGEDESSFVRIHDDSYIRSDRRLYLTATPRLYDDAAKAKVGEANALLASMDDEDLFGPEFYRLGFGEAVSRGLLADYKVLVLAVDETSVARTFQEQFKDDNNELQLNDYAKIIGCWNGLSKRGETEHTFADDPAPMSRAVAFAGNIKASRAIEAMFPTVVDQYIDAHDLGATREDGDGEQLIRTEVHHVDGGMSALKRNAEIDWLKNNNDESTCRILTNARCLSEGVDVPALDAVMFLSPRKSVVDVVQSVGRVMRKTKDKKYGYIILPIGIPAGMEPEEALRDNDRYRVVWDVLQALRAHDERFDAMVNKIDLNKSRDKKINVIGVRDGVPGGDGQQSENADRSQGTLPILWPELQDWRDAIYARIVKKVGNRRYWETWASDIAKIAEAHITRINALLDSPTSGVGDRFDDFLAGLKGNLNDNITRTDAIEMLAQHLITRPVFDALFEGYEFARHNPVAQNMQQMLDVLDEHQLDDENSSLEKFYESVRVRAKGIDNAEGRQRIIIELYDTFFKTAFPRTVDKLGIVYTPIEVVDFILNSADWALRREFGYGITDKDVHILDGFTGTGTFIVRLIQSGLISSKDLARKFESELHANEFLLLAYYIAAVNIETAFHDAMKEGGESAAYQPFPGLVLTDTFQSYEDGDTDDALIFVKNNERLNRQREINDIRVIIGNPPYSAGQESANDNNANEKYPALDSAIRVTYAERSAATLKNKLYDSYVRAIKWASLRIGDRGVVAYVTNGGWLDSNAMDGMRKSLADEFSSIYVFNLRGNQRTAGEESRREGGKIFDAGSRATVAIFLLVKNPGHKGPARINYRDIGDYLSREEKLRVIREAGSMANLETEVVVPNEAGDWINQRSGDFAEFPSINDIFEERTHGVNTGRDAWVVNSSKGQLEEAMRLSIDTFNQEVRKYQAAKASPESQAIADDPRRISWSRNVIRAVTQGKESQFDPSKIRLSTYRPFFKQYLYMDGLWNSATGQSPRLFPSDECGNRLIYVVGMSSAVPFSALVLDTIPNLHVTGAGSGGAVFARYRYEPLDGDDLFSGIQPQEGGEVVAGYRRIDNISDAVLARFQAAYGDHLSKDDIFHYCYGILHSPDYRSRYAADLKKMLPRVPLVEDALPFIDAGKQLTALHLNYESVEPYPLSGLTDLFAQQDSENYERYRVGRMRYGRPTSEQKKAGVRADKTSIVFNSEITLSGIPSRAHRFMVGSKSALDWIVERYKDDVDAKSNIRNDANAWSREVGDARYILDLVARIVTVSVKTVEIVDGLPSLTNLSEPSSSVVPRQASKQPEPKEDTYLVEPVGPGSDPAPTLDAKRP
ncbi:type ISP restriction/modification enzyme [Micromonospora chersina]|uniref:DEAD/DEAH box helicase n=1 Tax=Micromonospora chersina TaxID=47854 RepID=UPI00340B7FE5